MIAKVWEPTYGAHDTAKERLSAGARAEDKLDLTDERSLAFDVSAFAALLQAVEHVRDHSDKYLPNACKRLAIILRSKY